LVAELVARASAEGVSLTGEGGLLQQLTKLVLESSLEGELDAHLGYAKHDRAGRDGRQLAQRPPREDGGDRGRPG
jgi:putative transposase